MLKPQQSAVIDLVVVGKESPEYSIQCGADDPLNCGSKELCYHHSTFILQKSPAAHEMELFHEALGGELIWHTQPRMHSNDCL